MRGIRGFVRVFCALALVACGLTPGLARADGECSAEMPVVDSFEAAGLFAYSVGTPPQVLDPATQYSRRQGDVARVHGLVRICRAPISATAISKCLQQGRSTAPAIPAVVSAFELQGTTETGIPINLHESLVKPSKGGYGPFALQCDQAGTVSFASPAWAGFDFAFSMVAGAVQTELETELGASLGCLPGGPENIPACDNSAPYWAYRPVNEPDMGGGATGAPSFVSVDAMCLLPQYKGAPPARSCGTALATSLDGRIHSLVIQAAVVAVGGTEIEDIQTTGIDFGHSGFSNVTQVGPWLNAEQNGVWMATFLLEPAETASCRSMSRPPITVHLATQPVASTWFGSFSFDACSPE